MSRLDEVIRSFKEDKSWNTEEKNGTHRFDKEIAWIETMVKEYAGFFKMSADEVIDIMEKNRTYSWPNYYQKANFPDVSTFDNLVGIFKTFDEFKEHSKKYWKGFKCPVCGDLSNHPQKCVHRIKKDGKCNWCSYGFFKSFARVIILESGFEAIPIFEPVNKDNDE